MALTLNFSGPARATKPCAIASPMVILYFAAVGVAKILDRIRKRQEPAWMATPDDQASAI